MNCERFDEVIKSALSNYGPIGVKAELLTVDDKRTETPPYDWYRVVIEVTPVTAHPEPHADT